MPVKLILISAVETTSTILSLGLLALVLRSWFARGPIRSQPFIFLAELFSPILGAISRVMPNFGGLDFSPIIVLGLIDAARWALLRLIDFLP